LKIASFVGIKVCDNVLLAWDNTVIDTDFHSLKHKFTNTKIEGMGYVSIGNNKWIRTGCQILKNSCTPNYCVSASKSLLIRIYLNYGEKAAVGGIPVSINSVKHYWHIDYDIIAQGAYKE
jgi:acetyltransferase-like isoleucine patch superfamily enzyme